MEARSFLAINRSAGAGEIVRGDLEVLDAPDYADGLGFVA